MLVYTAALLLAPLPAMPFSWGTRGFAWGVLAWGAALGLASFYVARGEARLRARSLVGTKMLIASVGTLLLGVLLVVGSLVFLARS